jgi:PIN domain nuclease of toxin-antitoxin system
MKLLLDTHVFLWFISADQRLKRSHEQAIRDSANQVFLSVVSIWEATVKHALGRLPLPTDPAVYLSTQRQRHGISSLALDESSVAQLARLPEFHRDPFERMLICQALHYDLTIVTADKAFASYPVPLFGV